MAYLSLMQPHGNPESTIPNPESPFPSLLLWLLIQLATLAIGALQVPLSARYPHPPEQLALHVMLVVQVTAAAMLFPLLLRDWRSAAIVIVSSWPFVRLAGMLAEAAGLRVAVVGMYVSLWLIGLAVWQSTFRSYRAQLLCVAVAVSLALGGPLFWYLRMEFHAAAPRVDWARHGMLGPVMGALAQLEQEKWTAGPWVLLMIVIAAGLVLRLRSSGGSPR